MLETEHKLHILTPLLWPSRCVFLVLLDAQPEVLGSTAGCWLSLLHLISIFSGPQLIRASSPIGLVWPSLPHLVSNSLEFYWQLLWDPTQLNYITIQCPHDRQLDLWNRMFNCHQAEITVMQFRGYSLPVHHCSDLSHIISLNPPTRSLSITGHWNVSLPSGVSPWNSIFGPGRGSKYNIHPLIIFQNSTCGIFFTFVSINLTHILQNNLQRTIMAENIKKNHLNYSKQNLTLEATFSLCNTCPANYYLNFSYYLCVVGHLDMRASRYHTDAFFYPLNTAGPP